MSGAFLAGVVAGYGVAIPVGAIGALLIGLTARTSLRVGAAAALGVATADGVYALAAVLGGAAIADLIEPIAGPMRWAAVAVLVTLAVKTVLDARKQRKDKEVTARSAYFGLLGLTVLNPATIVYFGALVLGMRADVVPDLLHGMAFVLGALLASASWQLLLAGGGSLVGRVLTGQRGRMATAVVSSLVIVALAVRLVTG
ncbi:LysE family transporter [Kibdelosporangium phytohabitans]|uniref:Lysine transporter LysE n=1 Tax=Kibdelosporangium phytohabitans TaxID=860235 RepID=A0A0N9HYC3_9PSEU|nr:LysE family transporter [Kibdelosporangium phytohabitans]ALG07300.1 lysine transporter LysE [Kibdelosporangium phytohabitans]MBE1471835.1 arginine exporter protein ArgO [Kibdelosporangium phytohabitans]